MRELKYWQAINEALTVEMSRDATVTIVGEDIGAPGGPFGASRGLLDKFGDRRVRDAPISEQAIVGIGIGGALNGLRPVAEVMFFDFIALTMDQIVNQAAKISYMSHGRQKVPVTIRTLCGGRRNNGPQHSQNLEAWFAHVPGLKVVWGSTPADAKGLLAAAIRDDNPVIVIESLALWTTKGDVPEGEYVVEIGKAAIRRQGTDVTLVTYGGIVPVALKAADILAEDGISVEVIDLRTISPLDKEAILTSLHKTHRLAIAHDAVKLFGVGAEISAIVAEEAIDELDAPIVRVTSQFSPVGYSPSLEKAHYATSNNIVAAVKHMVSTSFSANGGDAV